MAVGKLESCNSTYTVLVVFFLFGLIFPEKSLFCDGIRKNFLNEKKLSVVSFSTFCEVCHMGRFDCTSSNLDMQFTKEPCIDCTNCMHQ